MLLPLGPQVRRLRLERKLSLQKLAERSGIGWQHIQEIEASKVEPCAERLVMLAQALAVPVGKLFDTITPLRDIPHHLSPIEIDSIAGALATLTTAFDRVVTREPPPIPRRASRGPRRRRRGR